MFGVAGIRGAVLDKFADTLADGNVVAAAAVVAAVNGDTVGSLLVDHELHSSFQ